MLEKKLIQYIEENESMLNDLRRVRDLHLPDGYIGAGLIRNYVWDRLHGWDNRQQHNDIDVIYFDPNDCTEERDRALENHLITSTGNTKWSVKNQARMHEKNGNSPYTSTGDAISFWPEVVTAIAVRIDQEDRLEVLAPYGLEDLFQLKVRRSPRFEDHAYYLARIHKKQWQQKWPLLQIQED